MQTTQDTRQHEMTDTAPLDPPRTHGPPSTQDSRPPSATAPTITAPTVTEDPASWTPPPWTPGEQALWITTGVIASTLAAVVAAALARGASF